MRVTNNILIKFGTQQLEWEYKGNFIVTCFHYFKICLCVSAFTWIENKYHSEILRHFQGCRSFRRRRKEEGLWHWCGDQSAHKRVFCQQGSPNRSFSADSSSHSLAFHINASFQASWPCWGTHSFLGQWRSQLSFGRGQALQAGRLPGKLEVVSRPLPIQRLLSPQTIQLLLNDHLIMKPVEEWPLLDTGIKNWPPVRAAFSLFLDSTLKDAKRRGLKFYVKQPQHYQSKKK